MALTHPPMKCKRMSAESPFYTSDIHYTPVKLTEEQARVTYANRLAQRFLEAVGTEGTPLPSSIFGMFLSLPVQYPPPEDVYLNGERKWCFDWYHGERSLCTVLSSDEKLIVIVDDAGTFLRLPCDLRKNKPLANLRLGLGVLFGDR